MSGTNLIIIASVFGFLSVALGAFGAHALKDHLDTYSMGVFQTGIQYQSMHALALLGLGILLSSLPHLAVEKSAQLSAWCLIIGILIFSGSLYALALTGIRVLGAVTPIGGLLFLIGWGALVKMALTLKGQA